jgi:hypothetical protein
VRIEHEKHGKHENWNFTTFRVFRVQNELVKVVGQYPGWNLRILPYMEYESVHNVFIENNRYTLSPYSLTNPGIRTFWEKNADDKTDWDACAEALVGDYGISRSGTAANSNR